LGLAIGLHARIVLILEEGELWDIVESPMVPPIDVVLLAEFRKRNIKAKRTILDAVKDHIIFLMFLVRTLHFRCDSSCVAFTRALTKT
jgi:hypothetical protein